MEYVFCCTLNFCNSLECAVVSLISHISFKRRFNKFLLLFFFLFTISGLSATNQNGFHSELFNEQGRVNQIGDGRGTLVLVGGGLYPELVEVFDALKAYLDQSNNVFSRGQKKARVGVICSAKASFADAEDAFYNDDPESPVEFPSYKNLFSQKGFEPVFIPITIDRISGNYDSAESPENASLIRSCEILYFIGGDQAKVLRCFVRSDGRDSEAMKAVKEVYRAGGIIMGSSAGMHVMSKTMFGWGESYETLKINQLETREVADVPLNGDSVYPSKRNNSIIMPGFGLLPDGILTDTHFDSRGRLGRLAAGMRDTKQNTGIGVDVSTTLFIEDGMGKVIGRRGVFILIAGNQSFPEKSGFFKAEKISANYLTSGDTFMIDTGEFFSSKKAVSSTSLPIKPSSDIFSEELDSEGKRKNQYQGTFVLKDFIRCSKQNVRSKSFQNNPEFYLEFSKTPESKAFYESDSLFSAFNIQMTINSSKER
ncbi:MAG: cyanophycinase [Candidatus Riflebacteria bacterium]|nr:cyanophycinase [Candidatus Riflebacteria bacterium]